MAVSDIRVNTADAFGKCMGEGPILGAVETGGTKIICAVGDIDGKITDRMTIPTEVPDVSVPKILEFFSDKDIDAIGIGAFGPIDVIPGSENYGSIRKCERRGWSHYPLLRTICDGLGVPGDMDTDVNTACLGEYRYGAGKGAEVLLYITVGTGIGIGITIDGRPLHGMMHPEGGHVAAVRHPDDQFEGTCPFHGGCIEGLACGPAIKGRWGAEGKDLADRQEVWEMEAHYLSQLVRNCMMTVAPNRIVMGGGVMQQTRLFPMIRQRVREQVNGYMDCPETSDMENYIVPSALGGDQALLGGFVLAHSALQGKGGLR
jgi:fructokinase